MIWLTWRQFRIQAIAVSAAAAALALVLLLSRGSLVELAHTAQRSFFMELSNSGMSDVYVVGFLTVLAVPAVIGVFWGAPLFPRELEAGTHRLVWSQSVTRTRWLITKLALIGLAAIAVTGVLSLGMSWWAHTIDTAVNRGLGDDNGFLTLPRFSPVPFAARGLAPLGYAVFAFALGVTCGLLIRRTVAAMAMTLVVFVAIQIAVPNWIRLHIAPVHSLVKITGENLDGMSARMSPNGPVGPVQQLSVKFDKAGAWVISNQTVDSAGTSVNELPSWVAYCVPGPPSGAAPGQPGIRPTGAVNANESDACFAHLASAGYRQKITYQPASRYWTFQAAEAAAFLGLALLLSGFCLWWVRRRLA